MFKFTFCDIIPMNIGVEKCQINPTTNGKRYIGDFDENDIITQENSKTFLKLTMSKLAVNRRQFKCFNNPSIV